jgi:MFS family permease
LKPRQILNKLTATKSTTVNNAKASYQRIAIATCFGTFLEWYDFLTFASLAVIFGPLFFPASNLTSGLMASLATFGVGMVVRPLGSALFGSLGDRIGRKPVFMITIILMGIATVSVGFLPTYAQIGIFAPIMLVALRLLQGLSAGGEIGGGAVYLTEHAGTKNRGLKTSFLQLMGPLGILASTLQITLLQQLLTPAEFLSWGWRVPFWVSLLLLIIAIFIRRSLEETPVFLELVKQQVNSSQLLNNFRSSEIRKRMFLLFFCVSSSGAILFFCTQVYTSIFLKVSVKLDSAIVDRMTILSTISVIPLTIGAGWLSDLLGRKPVVLSGVVLGALSIQPCFALLKYLGSSFMQAPQDLLLFSICLTLIFLAGILALVVGPQTALLAELFPAQNRNSAATLPHNLAAGWIGGLLPLIITLLNQLLGDELAGLWYPTIFLIISATIGLIYLPETNKLSLSPHSKMNHSHK